jgi:hypothetical protein
VEISGDLKKGDTPMTFRYAWHTNWRMLASRDGTGNTAMEDGDRLKRSANVPVPAVSVRSQQATPATQDDGGNASTANGKPRTAGEHPTAIPIAQQGPKRMVAVPVLPVDKTWDWRVSPFLGSLCRM